MHGQVEDPAQEVRHLRRCVNDLVSLLALRSVWPGLEPSQIIRTLLDALIRALSLEFACARLSDAFSATPIEIVRFAQSQEPIVPPPEIGRLLEHWLGATRQDWPSVIRKPLADRDVSIVPLELGLRGEIGVILAAAERADFPQQTEKVILSVAANQASIALQEARLVNEQKMVATELERHVAQRTAELAAANDQLLKEIASRKRVQEDLRSNEAKYRVIVEAASDAIVSMDERGTILFTNPATAKIFGYAPAELIGKSLTILMPEYMRQLHNNGFRRYLSTGDRHINWEGTELTALSKDGQEFPVEVSFGEVSREGLRLFTGFIRDISQRKHAEEIQTAQRCLVEVRADVKLAFGKHASVETVLHECVKSLVLHLDAAFARIWLLNPERTMLELRASAGLYTHLNGDHARIPMGALKIGVIAQQQKPILANDLMNDPLIGDKAWVAKEGMAGFAGHPLIVGERTVGVMAMFSKKPLKTGTIEVLASIADLIAQGIERQRAEDELRGSERRLKEMEGELARVARVTTMGELAASIAHEVNQPLTAVVNNGSACLRLLAKSNLQPDVLRRALDEIVSDGTRASGILARIRAFITKQTSEKSSLDINEVIREVLVLTGRQLNENKVLLDYQLRTDLPSVLADRIQLQQVLLNLIMNGIEAMAAVNDRPRLLEVQSGIEESGYVFVMVRDSGTGFGSEAERVFSPFFTTKANGMGMGLPISRSLVESHGGRLRATPNSPHGAVFSFSLPPVGGRPS